MPNCSFDGEESCNKSVTELLLLLVTKDTLDVGDEGKRVARHTGQGIQSGRGRGQQTAVDHPMNIIPSFLLGNEKANVVSRWRRTTVINPLKR